MAVVESYIAKIDLYESGTYVDMPRRGYETIQPSPETVLEFSDITQDGTKLSTGAIVNLAPNLIDMSAAHDGVVHVNGGWQEERMRVSIEVVTRIPHQNLTMRVFYHGWTDSADGVSASGHISPNLCFYINDFTVITEVVKYDNRGAQYIESRFVDASNILTGDSPIQGAPNSGDQILTPSNLFDYIQAGAMIMGAENGVSVLTATFGGQKAFCSDNRNSSPVGWFTRCATAVADARMRYSDAHYTRDELLTEAQGDLCEKGLNNVDLFNILDIDGIIERGFFTWMEVQQVTNGGADNLTTIHEYDIHSGVFGKATHSNMGHLTDNNQEAVIASIITSALPALMRRWLIQAVYMVFDNYSGEYNLRLIPIPSQYNSMNHEIVLEPSASIANPMAAFHNMVREFNQQISPLITNRNMMTCSVAIYADQRKDIDLRVTVNNYTTDFRQPTYMSATFSPVLTKDTSRLAKLAFDVGSLFETNDEVLHPGSFTNNVTGSHAPLPSGHDVFGAMPASNNTPANFGSHDPFEL